MKTILTRSLYIVISFIFSVTAEKGLNAQTNTIPDYINSIHIDWTYGDIGFHCSNIDIFQSDSGWIAVLNETNCKTEETNQRSEKNRSTKLTSQMEAFLAVFVDNVVKLKDDECLPQNTADHGFKIVINNHPRTTYYFDVCCDWEGYGFNGLYNLIFSSKKQNDK